MIAGSIYMFAGSTAPAGFLECDGSAVSRDTYATLFDVIGTTYGSGDGSTTFNVPDLSGKVALGVSGNHALATSGGEETHALTSSEIPSHTHSIAEHGHDHSITFTTPSLSHTVTQPKFTYNAPSGTQAIGVNTGSITCYRNSSSAAASRSANAVISDHAATACTMSGAITDCDAFDMDNNGSGAGHDNMQPYITMMYIIYTGQGE